MIRILAILVLLVVANSAHGMSGPQIPCPECENYPATTFPKTGWWFNPHEPGTGFNIEIQNGVLLGAYYGYDADGQSKWYLFQGALETTETSTLFRLEAPLQSYSDGSCLSCAYVPPVFGDGEGVIVIEFYQRNHAAFAVDGADLRFIVPLVYGVDAPYQFPEHVDYQFPNLTGTWVFLYENPAVGAPWGKRSEVLELPNRRVRLDDQGRTESVRYSLFDYSVFPELQGIGQLRCVSIFDNTTGGRHPPVCEVRINTFYPGIGWTTIDFPLAFANIGDERIEAVSEEGIILKVFRAGYH